MNDRTDVDLGIPLTVPESDAGLRFWRNTAVGNWQTSTLGQYIVGYEVDEVLDNGARPAGLVTMSSTSFATQSHVIDPTGTVVGLSGMSLSLWYMRTRSVAPPFASRWSAVDVSPIER